MLHICSLRTHLLTCKYLHPRAMALQQTFRTCSSTRPFASSRPCKQRATLRVASSAKDREQGSWTRVRDAGVSMAAAAVLLSAPAAAWADMVQTVPVSQMMQMAKPLPQQRVDKGRVWGITVGGAAALFLGTLAVENMSGLFPAIARANKASVEMTQATEAAEKAAANAQKPQPSARAPAVPQQQLAASTSAPRAPATPAPLAQPVAPQSGLPTTAASSVATEPPAPHAEAAVSAPAPVAAAAAVAQSSAVPVIASSEAEQQGKELAKVL